MDRDVRPMKLNDDVVEVVENRQDVVQPPGENLGPIRLFAAKTDVPPDGVALPAVSELAVMRDKDSPILRCVNRLMVGGTI